MENNFDFKANQKVLNLLYQYFVLAYERSDFTNEDFSQYILDSEEDNQNIVNFNEIMLNLKLLIEKISSLLVNWTFIRIDNYEKAILIFGAFYIYFKKDIDSSLVIWFCVENAKKNCAEKKHTYINGVLNKIKNER